MKLIQFVLLHCLFFLFIFVLSRFSGPLSVFREGGFAVDCLRMTLGSPVFLLFPVFGTFTFLFLYTQSAEYGAEEIGSRRCPDAVREWGSCWCICHLVGGSSSLAEIHGTQDEPRVGVAFWEQYVTPFSMPEEGYDTALA